MSSRNPLLFTSSLKPEVREMLARGNPIAAGIAGHKDTMTGFTVSKYSIRLLSHTKVPEQHRSLLRPFSDRRTGPAVALTI
jgi:hypothetical protein